MGGPYPIGTWCRNNNSIINNTIMSNEYNGIRLCGNNNLVKNNLIKDNSLPFQWGFNGGIYITGDNNLIEENYVENNYERNIYISGGFEQTYHSNGSVSVRIYGVNNTVKKNNVSIGNFGIDSVHYSRIVDNTINNQKGFYGTGIDLGGSWNGSNYIENNTLSGNNIGMYIFSSANNIILNNKFDFNYIGIRTYFATWNNTIMKNNFDNNNYNIYNNKEQSYNITAEYNWWGTVNQSEIASKIYDYYDDPIRGEVDYTPFLCESSPTDWISDSNGFCVFDEDNDGVIDNQDKCPNTIGQQIVYGCSCEQILALKPGEDTLNNREGCSRGVIDVFTKAIGWAKDLF